MDTVQSFQKKGTSSYIITLSVEDQISLHSIKADYGNLNTTALMKLTYQKYPYWALNSVKANLVLNSEEIKVVEKCRPAIDVTILYTIGYEGYSLENYLNRLIKYDVKVLVDVRNNPVSMKFGFSKGHLKRYCEGLGISYINFPEVGIESKKRHGLKTQADYDILFKEYRMENLSRTSVLNT